ncbi:MAG: Glycosyl transferase family 2 [Candidatus Woesebacteria bacterium GW2011_GWA1_39_21]|uniref:Glycosyl transferase family 2 n=1 Tax=Candidatus Woesebacteria bacterium GW2011_GWA1_39_21 TaxID=1618550 RepID=A0A0G0NFA9_9BACT|nr:MAG: Glycosyl transferase family 2 [Candidatus Woesebacteria bacterium GW2011_GWA1_39_21]
MKKPDLSIIYVNYNSLTDLSQSIRSLIKYGFKKNLEIIVVDNGHSKEIKKILSQFHTKVKLIRSKINGGYGAGNNLGALISVGKYLLFLNPDTEMKKGSIDVLYNFLEKNDDVAIVAPNLVDTRGIVFKQLGSRKLTPLRGIFSLSIINRLFSGNPIAKNYNLLDKDFNKVREADVVPGSAFMIRASVFKKVGGFDKRFFMYFEESDLCLRVKQLGYKIVIIPTSEIVHKWSDRQNKKLKKYFYKSRFYYFKKHFGVVAASFVEFICRLTKYDLVFILIFALGAYLRFYMSNKLFYLDSEVADNLLDIKNAYLSNSIPLIGPPTSHPWLNFGPLFYWIYGPILIFFKFNPATHMYFGLLVSCLAIFLNYFVVKRFWGSKIAVLSSLIISLSPFLLGYAYLGRFYTYTVTFSYLTLFLLLKFLDTKKGLFWLFFSVGLLLNFHYSTLVLAPAILLLITLRKIKLSFKDLFILLIAVLLPLSPLFIYDAQNHFVMLQKLFLWFPYRVLSVFWVINAGNVPQDALVSGYQMFFGFVGNLLSFEDVKTLHILAALTVFTLLLFTLIKFTKLGKYSQNLIIISGSSLFLLTLHGETPNHYFLFISPFILILITVALVRLFPRRISLFLLLLICSVLFFNIVLYLKLRQNKVITTYFQQKQVATFLVNDSNSKAIWLRRIGENDQFDGDFAQNYDYLLWMFGNEPVRLGNLTNSQKNPQVEYIIVEDKSFEDKAFVSMQKYSVSGVTILKKNL